jgi:hypothetical protein
MLEGSLAALNQEHVGILVRHVPHRSSMAVLTGLGMFNNRMSSFERDSNTRSSKGSSCATSFCACTFICDMADVECYLQIRGGSTSNRGCDVIASLVDYVQCEGEQTSQLIKSPFSVTFTKTAVIKIAGSRLARVQVSTMDKASKRYNVPSHSLVPKTFRYTLLFQE